MEKTVKMNIITTDNNLILENVKDFSLRQTLECGQCFHYAELAEDEFAISAFRKYLRISQKDDRLIFHNTTKEEYDNIWENYFDLKRDYGTIKEHLLGNDNRLGPSIEAMSGTRILNQEYFETLISFIISQNQQIPRIKAIVAAISRNYGEKIGDDMYAFPDAEQLLSAGVEGIAACKAGFRSPYIIDACEKYLDGTVAESRVRGASYDECIELLKQIKGVGDKVANCVALFSLGHRNAFPVDVWIKRIMESMYFSADTDVATIQSFAQSHFGEYGGYAQQYLFYYGKINEIGKKTRKTEKK